MGRGCVPLSIHSIQSPRRNAFQLHIQNIDIESGDIVALIGANGSGKTTLIESVLGITKTLERDIFLLAHSAKSFDEARCLKKRVGIQLQTSTFQRELKVYEIVKLHKLMYGKQSSEVVQRLGIPELKKSAYQKLSRGQKQRVDLFLALAHEPELLFLDEPTTGLDATYKRIFFELITQFKLCGASILMGSHVLEEMTFCNKALWLASGQLKHFGQCQTILEQVLGRYRIDLVCETEPLCQDLLLALEKLPVYWKDVCKKGCHLILFCNQNHLPLVMDKVEIERCISISCRKTSLVDLMEKSQGDRNDEAVF